MDQLAGFASKFVQNQGGNQDSYSNNNNNDNNNNNNNNFDGGNNGGNNNNFNNNNNSNSNSGNSEDYLDKALDNVESKYGMDPTKMRGINEKITDTARNEFESATGYDIPNKFSN
ncbi:hypothetical protein MPDQ_004347 [Monascus purpureus]|uniref:Uncharacterized protein n=1 Tax=Monascus purpureus TaxID=5098 RepID=A0A507R197_MONPU|nr:hypothetical protein MPDQ_004347 [Monascus purpureus]